MFGNTLSINLEINRIAYHTKTILNLKMPNSKKMSNNHGTLKAAYRIVKMEQNREEAEERAKTDHQVIVPSSIHKIMLNCFHTDEVNDSP